MQRVLLYPVPLLLVGAASTRRGPRRRRARLGSVLAGVVLTAVTLAGCGGSDGDKAAASASGQTYTITVTAAGATAAGGGAGGGGGAT